MSQGGYGCGRTRAGAGHSGFGRGKPGQNLTAPDVTVNFAYEAFIRRSEKTIAGTKTRFAYDGAQATTELHSGNAVTATLLSGLGLDECSAAQARRERRV